VAETPVPLPLVLFLVALALASLATSFRNPLNRIVPFMGGLSPIGETRKAISLQRINAIGQAVDKFHDTRGQLPFELKELVPHYLAPSLLRDPWGNGYKYIPGADRYLVIGFTAEGKPDTDLFLNRNIDTTPNVGSTKPQTGGIRLID
jgi:hypothetical protein